MDERQRRVWEAMVAEVDACQANEISLARLAENLRGLIAASELHDPAIEREWWDRFYPVDMELERRTESWASSPPSDESLGEAVANFRGYVVQVLEMASGEVT